MSKLRYLAIGSIAAVIVGITGFASAESPKTCEEAYKVGWTQTKEQTAQCESSSDNKHETPEVNTNPGGNVPPGAQP